MSNLSNEQLENLLTLAQAAMPGEWKKHDDSDEYSTTYLLHPGESVLDEDGKYQDFASFSHEDDANYAIATQPRTVRLLIQELLQHRASHATGEAGEAHDYRMLEINDFGLHDCEQAPEHAYSHIRYLLSLLPPAPAPQPAASRCGSGGVGEEDEWVPVTDGPPVEEGYQGFSADVLLWLGNDLSPEVGYYDYRAGYECYQGYRIDEMLERQPTHWQYIQAPTPPSCPRTCRTCRAAGDAGEAKEA